MNIYISVVNGKHEEKRLLFKMITIYGKFLKFSINPPENGLKFWGERFRIRRVYAGTWVKRWQLMMYTFLLKRLKLFDHWLLMVNFKVVLTDITSLSQHPPMWGALGGMKCHFIPCLEATLWMWTWFNFTLTFLSLLSLAVKFVPLSENISDRIYDLLIVEFPSYNFQNWTNEQLHDGFFWLTNM